MSAAPLQPVAAAAVSDRILAPLARVRRWSRWYLVLDGLTHLLVALIAAGAMQLLLDRWLRLSLDQRAAVNVVITLFWLWVIYRRVLIRVIRPLPDRALATAVDRRYPELHDQIATAVQFASGAVGPEDRNSPALVRAALEDACATAGRLSFQSVLNHQRARRTGIHVGVLAAGIVLAFVLLPQTMTTWFSRNWLMRDIPWPQSTYIVPVGYDGDGTRRMPEGDDLEIVAHIRGETPDRVTIEWWTASGRRGVDPMVLVGESGARASLGVLTEDTSFRIVGGDERTRDYRVLPVERPSITRTVVHIVPPLYAGLEPAELEQQSVVELLKGSRVRIEASINKPLRSVRFVGPTGDAGTALLDRPDHVVVELAEPASGVYAFELTDIDGWDNRRSLRYTLKVVPDAAPTVRATLLDVGDAVTPQAEIPIELAFADTYGLSRVAVLAQRGDDPPVEVPLEDFEPRRREFQAEIRFAVATMSTVPGQRIRIWAEAADFDPTGPNVGRSEPVELRILSPIDLAGELAAREQELRREFERLISEQSGLKDAIDRLLPTLPDAGAPPPPAAQRVASLARRQESHAGRTLAVRRGFAQILAEMHTSKIAKSADERRITDRIVTPLEEVGGQSMPAAAAALAELRRQVSRAQADRVPVGQADLLRQMRTILASMVELEGFREAVALLQEIIAEQSSVRTDTSSALADLVDEIIGPSEPNSDPPSGSP